MTIVKSSDVVNETAAALPTLGIGIDKCLLLVTYEFPYATGETFLEAELPILSDYFSKIIIVPSRMIWSPNKGIFGKARTVPPGISVVGSSTRSIFSYISICINTLIVFSKCDVFCSKKRFQYWTWKHAFWALRVAYKAALLEFELVNATKKNMLCFGYSYWMAESAVGLARLVEKGGLNGFVARCHGGDLYEERQPSGKRLFDEYLMSRSSAIVPVSESGVSLLAAAGFPDSKVALHRLGVSIPDLQGFESSKINVFRIVSCSSLIELKRVDLLARSLVQLKQPFEWVHFGDGCMADIVKAISKDFPSWGRAVFMGRCSNNEVLSFYSKSRIDLFINVSTTEGVPVSVMEALAHGVPCMATAVGGTSEIVDDTCGVLLPANISVEELTFSIERFLMLDDSKKSELRQGAFSMAKSRCDAKKNFEDFSSWLAGVAKDLGC